MRSLGKYILPLLTLCTLSLVSCEKYNEVPAPSYKPATPGQELPLPTHTISQLKALYQRGGVTLSSPIVVSAVMASDDSEGNLYKSCFIQDETGGIELKFAMGSLSTLYPQGSRVLLLCQGLTLGAYGGQIGLGYRSSDPKYETAFYPEKLVPLALHRLGAEELQPRTLTIDQLSKQYASTLVRIEGVQFVSSELGQTYASPEQKTKVSNVNRTLTDRSGKTLIVRTSSYGKFAGKTLPEGSGSIVALLTYFRETPQLLILRESDVQLSSPRF